MSQSGRHLQGLRGKKILDILEKKETVKTVTQLRRPTDQEYEEVFGTGHPLATGVTSSGQLGDYRYISTRDQDDDTSQTPLDPDCAEYTTSSVDGTSCLSHGLDLEYTNLYPTSMSDHCAYTTRCVDDGPDQVEYTILSPISGRDHAEYTACSIDVTSGPSHGPDHDYTYLHPISAPDQVEYTTCCGDDEPDQVEYTILNLIPDPDHAEYTACSVDDTSCPAHDPDHDYTHLHSISVPDHVEYTVCCDKDTSHPLPGTNLVGDTIGIEKTVDIISTPTPRLISVQRFWSLSDLTQDNKDDFSSLRRRQSLPTLTENSFLCVNSDSPSILLAFHQTRHVNLPSDNTEDAHNHADDDANITDCESETDKNNYGYMNEGRKRKHIPDSSNWKKNKAKIRRMQGDEYMGYSKDADGKYQQDTLKSGRQLKERCASEFCKKSALRHCETLTEESRKKIHSHFWKQMSWDQRKVFVNGLVKRTETLRKTTEDEETSRRSETLTYYLPVSPRASQKAQVCRKMFLNTLSIGSFTVQSWTKTGEYGMSPRQEMVNMSRKYASRPIINRKMLTLENFFNHLPKLPSHYARKETTKLFLEPTYRSLIDLFKTYKNYCAVNEEPYVSRFTFEHNFREKNLSLYTLKKDMCDVCSSYKAGNLAEEDYQIHLIKKNRARREKEDDKKKAAAGDMILLTMDLESVKVCPYLTASALYFKTKLTCHNFTVFDLITKHCSCYWFDETAADLTSSTFASFLVDYLERHCIPKQLPIVVYSDGCTYQNRNTTMANALLQLSKKHNITITQKFLEPGHTQMECDSVHSTIERKLKNREIHLPSNYITVTKEARVSDPYESIAVDHTFVKDYARSENLIYKNIRPGRRAGDPQVVDIRAIKYNTMTIEVKLGFDEDWQGLPQRPKLLTSEVVYRQLHASRIPIAATKFNHLQQLKAVLPQDCHAFYDDLPYV